MSFSPVIPGVGAAALYLAGACLQLRYFSRNVALPTRVCTAIALAALVLHAIAAYGAMSRPDGLDFSLSNAASLTALILVALVSVLGIAQPVHGLFILLFPLSALALLASIFLQTGRPPLAGLDAGLAAHIFLSMLAYSILAMAALQSILLGAAERGIRAKTRIAILGALPPLETMERLLFAMLWVGFAALTVAIGSGFLRLQDMFAQHVVHHTVLSSASWLLYFALLTGRHAFGWRGSSAVRWSLTAFSLLLLGYFGSKFVLEVLLEPS